MGRGKGGRGIRGYEEDRDVKKGRRNLVKTAKSEEKERKRKKRKGGRAGDRLGSAVEPQGPFCFIGHSVLPDKTKVVQWLQVTPPTTTTKRYLVKHALVHQMWRMTFNTKDDSISF